MQVQVGVPDGAIAGTSAVIGKISNYVAMSHEQGITLADHFRALASRLRGQAANSTSPAHKAECERLADCYTALAGQHSPIAEVSLRRLP